MAMTEDERRVEDWSVSCADLAELLRGATVRAWAPDGAEVDALEVLDVIRRWDRVAFRVRSPSFAPVAVGDMPPERRLELDAL